MRIIRPLAGQEVPRGRCDGRDGMERSEGQGISDGRTAHPRGQDRVRRRGVPDRGEGSEAGRRMVLSLGLFDGKVPAFPRHGEDALAPLFRAQGQGGVHRGGGDAPGRSGTSLALPGRLSDFRLLGTYTHNLFLDLFMHYGVVFGVLIVVAFMTIISVSFYKSENKMFTFLMFCFGFLPLMVSGTYLVEAALWIYLGYCCRKLPVRINFESL